MRPLLFVCVFVSTDALAELLALYLPADRYAISFFKSKSEFLLFAGGQKQQLDCLIFEYDPTLLSLSAELRTQDILLPAVILGGPVGQTTTEVDTLATATSVTEESVKEEKGMKPGFNTAVVGNTPGCFYHMAEVKVSGDSFSQISDYIHQAMTEFLNLSPKVDLTVSSVGTTESIQLTTQHYLMQQQHRLAEKLRERLGYLGVYYKRNPQGFLRNLSLAERQELLALLKDEYREIVLHYFSEENSLNQKIDNFVNIVFFADIPVTNIVEIHMELMDEFSKQLKLEGRSEEVLLDYRLTLIDTIAHLCEMYRRSIPRDS